MYSYSQRVDKGGHLERAEGRREREKNDSTKDEGNQDEQGKRKGVNN